MAGLWPKEAVAFLRDLEDNNDREWFKANRTRYDSAVAAPRDALAEALRSEFGRPKTFRPYHDTRFHAGPAIKEQCGVAFGYGEGGLFYVELSLDGLFVAAGLHAPAKDQVARLREAVVDGRRGAALQRALDTARKAGLSLPEPDLKRGPRGFDPDHPRADLLRYRRMVVSERHALGAWVHRAEGVDRVRTQFEAARTLVDWLRKHVGPTQETRERR